MNTQQPTTEAQPSFDVKLTTPLVCERCKGESFIEALMFRKVSPILTKTGKAALLPIQTMACLNCGLVPSEFIPSELKDSLITPSKLTS